jgi:hypothetical protein
MQKIAAKRLDLQLVAPTLDICEHLGIETTASFITGYPEETHEDQRLTLDLLGKCFSRTAGSCIPQLHILTPEPGTPLFDTYGEQLGFDGYATPFNAWLLGDRDRNEILAAPDIFSSYYFYPASLDRAQHVAVVEAVDLLRKLSRTLLAALIREHEGSLADLVLDLIEFAETTPCEADLASYFLGRLGDSHPLTSAVRYELFADRPTRRRVPEARVGGVALEPGASYGLPTDAEILHDIHTYNEVRQWLYAAPCPATFSRSSYVRLADRGVIARIDPATAELLELFRTGRSARQVAEVLELPDTDPIFCNALSDLISAGLLVRRAEVMCV